mgnify:CR=1 FL=1
MIHLLKRNTYSSTFLSLAKARVDLPLVSKGFFLPEIRYAKQHSISVLNLSKSLINLKLSVLSQHITTLKRFLNHL